MRFVKPVLVVLVVALVAAMFYAERRWSQTYVSRDVWSSYELADVRFDARGIPTVEAASWEAVTEAQGYVMASERFFHMDLLRRAAAGRLAELFGPPLVDFDRPRHEEDWQGAADRSYAALPAEQKAWVDAYARGVNSFLDAHPDEVGVEYAMLGVAPERWQGRDSLLVLLIMAWQLSKAAEEEAARQVWQDRLPKEWFRFMYTEDHPLNRPLFGEAPRPGPVLPQAKLEAKAVDASELSAVLPAAQDELLAAGPGDESMGGAGASNNWAWCGSGQCFLANDPHLGATVPHVWYAMRLKKSAKEWAVGVAIPGIPGITLGMNPYLAWAFTNTGEDVDDFLEETLSEDGSRYVARLDAEGQPVWADVEVKAYQIKVRGEASVTGQARFTHRGPLSAREHLDPSKQYSRQWLPLKEGMLRMPIGVNRATTWADMDAAFDEMRAPAQNVLVVDYEGNIAYRTSGTGVVRKTTGRLPQTALQGEWQGFEPYDTRPRLFVGPTDGTRTATEARFVATANERLWVDEHGERWAEDLRADRIREVLSGLEAATHEDMTKLQRDTVSRYHRDVLRWVAEHATAVDEAQAKLVAAWKAWDGTADGAPMITAQAIVVEDRLREAAVARVRARYLSDLPEVPYVARLGSAWMIAAMRAEGGFEVFGFDEAELANALLTLANEADLGPHPEANRWRAQHPFVGRVPVLGDRFAVPEPAQPGHLDVPRVESPKYGASCRLVWDLKDPLKSTWAMPVGQSGHPASPHYSDLMAGFRAGEAWPVFEDGGEWWVAPRGPALR